MMMRSASRILVVCAVVAAPVSTLAGWVTSIVPNGSSTANPANFVGRTVNVTDFGAQCNAVSGSGNNTLNANEFVASGSTLFTSADNGKYIVISGAGNWALQGYVNPLSNAIFNVGSTQYGTNFFPSLTGAAGGAGISDGSGLIPLSDGYTIAVGYWGSPEVGTFTLSTTGTYSATSNALSVATGSAQLVGQNGQPVLNSSGSALLVPVQNGMYVNTVLDQNIVNDMVTGVSGTSITLASNPSGTSTAPDLVVISGYPNGASTNVVVLNAASRSGSANATDSLTIPGAPLATTISGIMTPTNTISLPATPVIVPSSVATKVTSIEPPLGGGEAGGYNVGDFALLGDNSDGTPGTVLQVTSTATVGGVSGVITSANVYAQTQIWNLPSPPYDVLGTSGHGAILTSGAQFKMRYSQTGQFWYGTDDSSAINLALSGGFVLPTWTSGFSAGDTIIDVNSTQGVIDGMLVSAAGISPVATVKSFTASTITLSIAAQLNESSGTTVTITGPQLPQGSDIWLPANRACGVASPVYLPDGNNSLRGWDALSSSIVALAPMPVVTDTGLLAGASFVVERPTGVNAGGGMRDLLVEANKLALYGVSINGGEGQFYQNVTSLDALGSEWLCGLAATQINGTIFDHIGGETNFGHFGPIADRPANDFLALPGCEDQEVLHSLFAGGWTAVFDNQSDYNLYLGDIEDDIEPFNPAVCVETTGNQTVLGDRCSNSSLAGIEVNGWGARVADIDETYANAVPWNGLLGETGATYGATIAPGVRNSLIEGLHAKSLPGTDAIMQQGIADPSTLVVDNPGASYAAAGSLAPGILPQGRLTLTNGVPVMTGGSTVPYTKLYYAPYVGNQIPIDVSGVLQYVSFGSGLVHPLDNNIMDTNYVEAGYVYDEFIGLSGGLPVLCNGPAWTSATARSLALEVFNGVLANAASFTCNFGPGGSAYSFSCPEDNCTYLGTFYAFAPMDPSPNGKITFNPAPAAASGGASAIVGFWNAYNRVPLPAVEQDSASAYGALAAHVWEGADARNSGTNNIVFVDGYQQTSPDVQLTQVVENGTPPPANPELSVSPGNEPGCLTAAVPVTFASQQSYSAVSVSYNFSALPRLGLQCVKAMEYASAITSQVFNINSYLTMRLNWQY